MVNNVAGACMEEMMFDEECSLKKSETLIELYENQDEEGKKKMNEIFIALCGWSFDSLLQKNF